MGIFNCRSIAQSLASREFYQGVIPLVAGGVYSFFTEEVFRDFSGAMTAFNRTKERPEAKASQSADKVEESSLGA